MNKSIVLFFVILTTLSILGLMINYLPGAQSQPNSISTKYENWTFPAYNLQNFSIIVLPDTQYYSEGNPHVFENQTQWIVNNIDEMNIVFVSLLGDIVDEWYSIEQWINANNSMSKLDDQVPWGVLLGNHDGLYTDPDNFEIYFGRDRFENESWYGGAHGDGNKNSYQLFSAGADDYLFLHIQYAPNEDMLEWAGNVIDNYPSRRVIVSTHEYIDWWWNDWHSVIGENIYEKLVKPHADQIFLVLCGHIDYVATEKQLIDGSIVYEMISDYQEQPNGGNGWLKILEFSPLQNKIFVKTYSPYLDLFNHDPNSEFTLDYNMTQKETKIGVQMTDSSLQDININIADKQINVTISGEIDTIGFCNVTIPKELNLGDDWVVQIDGIQFETGISSSYYEYENATHQALLFKYIHTETSNLISFIETGSIPEFSSLTFLIALLTLTVLGAIFYRKKLKKQV